MKDIMELKNKLDAILDDEYADIFTGKNGAISAAISKNNAIIYEYNRGFTELNGKSYQVCGNTIFNIGSVSKIFTTIAVLILCDMGKLKLDNKISCYFDNFYINGEKEQKITVRMLLNHSSGLRGTLFGCGVGYRNINVVKNYFEKLRESSLQYEPSSNRIYCDDGFLVAQMLIEKISGMSFIEFIKKEILFKLQMHDTYKSLGELCSESTSKLCFCKNGKPETLSMYGVAGLSSTAYDLCLLGSNLCLGKNCILSAKSLHELFFNGTPGLGWDYNLKFGNSELWSKRGKTTEYSSLFIVCPDQNTTISLICSDADKSLRADKLITDTVFETKKHSPSFKNCLPTEDFPEIDGIYIGNWDMYDINFNREKAELVIHSLTDSTADSIFLFGNSRKFYKKNNDLDEYYFKIPANDTIEFYRFDKISQTEYLKYRKLSNKYPSELPTEWLDNKLWLKINETPGEVIFSPKAFHVTKPNFIYSNRLQYNDIILFYGTQYMNSCHSAKPILPSGYQLEVKFETVKNNVTANLSGVKYIMADNCLSELRGGITYVTIDKSEDNRWFKITRNGTLFVHCRVSIRILIFAENRQIYFDSLFDNENKIEVKHGMLLKIVGNFKDAIQINFRDIPQ